MNRTKIEWTDYSWNPIVGCKYNCWYCYAKKMTVRFPNNFPNGFEPSFYPERLNEPSKLTKPSKIFCCSIADIFADWTKEQWRRMVLRKIIEYKESKPFLVFQLLTKQPQSIDKNFEFPDNVWIGVTVNNNEEIWKVNELKKVQCKTKFVSFEPLLDGITHLDLKGIDWVIVGKLTGSKRIKLKEWWVDSIVQLCKQQNVPIFMKNNLKPDYEGKLTHDFPEVVKP